MTMEIYQLFESFKLHILTAKLVKIEDGKSYRYRLLNATKLETQSFWAVDINFFRDTPWKSSRRCS